MKSILVAIPVYNEVAYIEDILTAVSLYSNNILVINDGSDDGTERLLKKYKSIQVLTHQENEGYGQSLIDAFAYAKTLAYDWIITMDCDRQHQPSCLPQFFSEIEKDDGDIISGSRYLNKTGHNKEKVPAERKAINWKITTLLNRTLELKLTDAFCGFKAYRVESLKKLALTEKGYALPLELWVQADWAQLRIRETPVPLIYHDPQRNFAGLLEVPGYRMQYYMNVIHKTLTKYGYQNTSKPVCS